MSHVAIRRTARALLLTDKNELVFFKRTVPGRELYWSTPGGKIDPGDADAEAALRRELWEELGAKVGAVEHVLTLKGPTPAGMSHQTIFVTRLVSMDVSQRTGHEFSNPAKGQYDIEFIPCEPAALARVNVVPEELASYLRHHAPDIRRWQAPTAYWKRIFGAVRRMLTA